MEGEGVIDQFILIYRQLIQNLTGARSPGGMMTYGTAWNGYKNMTWAEYSVPGIRKVRFGRRLFCC
jgi:hypothetical protein